MKSRHKLQLAWAVREHRAWEIHDGQTMAYELFPPKPPQLCSGIFHVQYTSNKMVLNQ